uniref:Uncharacterized protein n=1 Tax=viral metagenome TaxID=1070528 RepID=A0A6C0BZU6_9ZZZZ
MQDIVTIPKHSYKQTSNTPAGARDVRDTLVLKRSSLSSFYGDSVTPARPSTPAIVAQFGARCEVSGSITMLKPKQEPLLTPAVRSTLAYYCKAAKRAQTRDMSHLQATPIYWKGSDATGVVSYLGLKRGLKVYNLIGNTTPPETEIPHNFKKAAAFGTPIGKASWAVFLDYRQNHPSTFRFGQILQHAPSPGIRVILVNSREYEAFTQLIAPVQFSFAIGPTLQHTPANGELALANIAKLLAECAQDQYIRSRLLTAKDSLHAAMRLDSKGKVAPRARAQLEAAAEKLEYAAVHLHETGNKCPTTTSSGIYEKRMKETIALMDILVCRIRIADSENKPDLVYSTSDEDFIRELADILREGKSDDHDARKCMSTLTKHRPRLVQAAQLAGMSSHPASILDESFAAIQANCEPTGHDPSDRKSAQAHLIRLSKDKNENVKLWRTALTLNSDRLSHRCKDATQHLMSSLNDSRCRKLYVDIIEEHNPGHVVSSATETRSLANEVLVQLESDGSTHKALENSEVSECLLRDEGAISQQLEAKPRAASPSTNDAETLAEIDKDEAIQLKEIVKAQGKLRVVCERANTPEQSNNPILRGSSKSSMLASLLAHEGRIDIVKASETASKVEKILDIAETGETKAERDAREKCRHAIMDFDKDARNRQCTIRIMRKLGVAPSGDPQRYREKLAKLMKEQLEETQHEGEGPERELDELCAHSLSPKATAVEHRAIAVGKRQCAHAAYKEIVKTVCSKMSSLGIPINFLDFLSILCLSVLPPWPYNIATMQNVWLPARQVAMKHENGTHVVCEDSSRIIGIHAPTAGGKNEAFDVRNAEMLSLLRKLQNGASLAELSKCACTSKDVMTAEQRHKLAQSTSWYWRCSEALITGGAEDARLITSARQTLVAQVLKETLQGVSLTGVATLHTPRLAGPSILEILWKTYLTLLFGGVLDTFRLRIAQQHASHTPCFMAMIDSFFFVVLLDLYDVSEAITPEAGITDMVGLAALSKKNAAIGALGLAVLGKLAGTVLDEQAFETVTDKVAEGATQAGNALLQATIHEAKRSSVPTLGEASKGPPKQHDSAVKRGYKKLFTELFPFKKGSVNDVLIKLCLRDSHSHATPYVTKMNPLEHAETREEKLKTVIAASASAEVMHAVIERENITPPLCFPLPPPGAGNPPKTCLDIC